ncbi:hypothetical protein BDV96DRAFT_631376 [Lophiotrema nucula]|uniref:Uncharacterized protein n=1 Tax=Lophiotrema nucula TaxID=690887 RepID=A0A6A5ZAK4_9PLEO|nr:hypothetical protein BDV96DRAFT_631376 [Lophiotrema nucula]
MAEETTGKRPIDKVSDVEDNARPSKTKPTATPSTQQEAAELHGYPDVTSLLKANQAHHLSEDRDQYNDAFGSTKSSISYFLKPKAPEDGGSNSAQTLPTRTSSTDKAPELQSSQKAMSEVRAASSIPKKKSTLAETSTPSTSSTLQKSKLVLDSVHFSASTAEAHTPFKLPQKNSKSSSGGIPSSPSTAGSQLPFKLQQKHSSPGLTSLASTPQTPKLLPDGLISSPSTPKGLHSSTLPKKRSVPKQTSTSWTPEAQPKINNNTSTSKDSIPTKKTMFGMITDKDSSTAKIGQGKYPWHPDEITWLQLYYTKLIVKASHTPIQVPMSKLVREDFDAWFVGRVLGKEPHPGRTIPSVTAKVNNICMELKARLEALQNENWDADIREDFRPAITQEEINSFAALRDMLNLKDGQAADPALEELAAKMMNLPAPKIHLDSGVNDVTVETFRVQVPESEGGSEAASKMSE